MSAFVIIPNTSSMFRHFYLLLFLLGSLKSWAQTNDQTYFDQALANGKVANEAFLRSHRFLLGWLGKADPATGLIPRNLTQSTCIWNAWDAAADN